MTRKFFALLAIVLAAGVGALAWATEGFRVATRDGALRLAVMRAPVPVPDVRMTDQDGRSFSFADYRGRRVLVEFIYTRCPTICGVLGDDFRRVLDERARAPTEDRQTDLLSISFDPKNDDPAALAHYSERFGAAAPRWRIAAPRDARGLAALLRSFGVVVIPDGVGGYIHNAAIYLVDERGRLIRILDPGAASGLAAGTGREADR